MEDRSWLTSVTRTSFGPLVVSVESPESVEGELSEAVDSPKSVEWESSKAVDSPEAVEWESSEAVDSPESVEWESSEADEVESSNVGTNVSKRTSGFPLTLFLLI